MYTQHICTHPFKKDMSYQSAATCTPLSPVAAKAFSLYKDQGMTTHYEQKNRQVAQVLCSIHATTNYVVLNLAYMDTCNVIGQCLGCPALALPKCKMYFNKLWWSVRPGMKKNSCFWWQVPLKYIRDLIKGKQTQLVENYDLGSWYVEWRCTYTLSLSGRREMYMYIGWVMRWVGEQQRRRYDEDREGLCYWLAIHVCNGIHIITHTRPRLESYVNTSTNTTVHIA